MSNKKIILFLTRLSFGTLFLYAGITKVFNPDWSSAGYLNSAKTFSDFYALLASPNLLPFVDMLNQWGLTLIGTSLLVGLFVRVSASLGALMMILYYLPGLDFPYAGEHSFIVDEHIIYALGLVYLAMSNVGQIWGLESKFPKLFKK